MFDEFGVFSTSKWEKLLILNFRFVVNSSADPALIWQIYQWKPIPQVRIIYRENTVNISVKEIKRPGFFIFFFFIISWRNCISYEYKIKHAAVVSISDIVSSKGAKQWTENSAANIKRVWHYAQSSESAIIFICAESGEWHIKSSSSCVVSSNSHRPVHGSSRNIYIWSWKDSYIYMYMSNSKICPPRKLVRME